MQSNPQCRPFHCCPDSQGLIPSSAYLSCWACGNGADPARGMDHAVIGIDHALTLRIHHAPNLPSLAPTPRCLSILVSDHYPWKQRSSCSSGRACHPHACCAFTSAPCARKAVLSSACCRIPLLHVNSPDVAAAVVLPPACSDCACLHVIPVVGPLISESTALTPLRINCRRTSVLYNSLERCSFQPPISSFPKPHGLVA